jgi:hypothetical protein
VLDLNTISAGRTWRRVVQPAFWDGASDDEGVQDGDRMLIPCNGGPSISRLIRYPPPLEIDERGGVYVLVDDGPPELWRYEFIRPER